MFCVHFKHAVSAIALFVFGSTSQAALLSVNDVTFGANSITHDSATGLDWLDINFSDGMSFQTVSGQLGAGGTFGGFRHATAAELHQFILNAGINPAAPIAVFNFAPVQSFETLVGGPTGTQSVGVPGFSGLFVLTRGMTSDIVTATTRNYGGVSWTNSTSLGGPAGFGSSTIGSENVGTANPLLGHWLVRTVPEPGTLSLLIMGAMMLLPRRRRGKAGCS